jgi:hypothetical protein
LREVWVEDARDDRWPQWRPTLPVLETEAGQELRRAYRPRRAAGGSSRGVRQNFRPPHEVRHAVVRRLKESHRSGGGEAGEVARRAQLRGQLERLKDLYVLGDLPRDSYLQQKAIIEGELGALEPEVVTDVTAAAAALTNFGLFVGAREGSAGEEQAAPSRLRDCHAKTRGASSR